MSGNLNSPLWSEQGATPRFAALARHLRTSARLSQGALAQAASLSPSTIRGWEASRSEPSMPELIRWSRALDLSEGMLSAVRATLVAPRAWADRPGIGIGPYLRERRLAGGTTLSRAAAEIGLPLATLGHYESGRVEVPAGVRSALVERFAVGAVERAALCDGPSAFLEWCDSLVENPDQARERLHRAAYAVTPAEIHDRGPAFVRLRTGLLRVRLRGAEWEAHDAFAASSHALWLAVGDRRSEAAAALAAVRETPQAWPSQPAAALVASRYLGRSRAEDLERLAERTKEIAVAAWLRSEAALDRCERRKGFEARTLAERAEADADTTGSWQESWTRRRDSVRVLLRLQDWSAAEAKLDAMKALEPSDLPEGAWYALQRDVLAARLVAHDATARSAGA